MEDLKALKLKRTGLRISFTKTTNILKSELLREDFSEGLLRDKFIKLENVHLDIKNLDDRILDLLSETSEEEVLKEIEEREVYSDDFITLTRQINEKLAVSEEVNVDTRSNDGSNNCCSKIKQYRLPKIELKKFDGELINWLPFWSQFEKIHNDTELYETDKFSYLIQCMKHGSRAEEFLESYPVTSENYDKAVLALKERFGKPELLVEVYVRELIKLIISNVKADNKDKLPLEKLYDKIEAHLRALESLGLKSKENTSWLFPMVESCLTEDVLKAWQRNSLFNQPETTDISRLSNLMKFLKSEVEGEERLKLARSGLDNGKIKESYRDKNRYETKSNVVSCKNISTNKNDKFCLRCSGSHRLFKCMKFKGMDLNARKLFVKRNNLCFLCLNSHKIKECPNSHLKCLTCQGRHNSLLHEEVKGNNAFVSKPSSSSKPEVNNADEGNFSYSERSLNYEVTSHAQQINATTSVGNSKHVSFLPTAKVLVYNNEGKSFPFRALLDSGSECSFISENVINILGLKRKNNRLCLSGIAGISAGTTRGSVYIKIGSRFSEEFIEINAYVLNKVTSQIPLERFNVKELDYLKNIPLSDEEFSQPSECDIILGSDCFFTILRNAKIVGSVGQPIAQNTMFGWVVAGQIQSNNSSVTQSHFICMGNDNNIDSVLQRFWQTEELSIKKPFLSEEEIFCENYFKSTYKLNDEGRFVVKLPVYKEVNQLGDTKRLAVSRLLAMETKFKSDPKLEKDYKDFMLEYKQLNHMSLVKDSNSSKGTYFLPHHAVRKSDSITTKLHVVFDGSCNPPNSLSLNSILGVGQVLQPDLFTILIRFRISQFAFTADIQQMYRQILVDPEDQNLQRIVWRNSSDADIEEYRLSTVTYGTSSAPFLATRCLYQVALDYEEENAEIAKIIKDSFYMDDLMGGATSSKEAISVVKELSEVLDARGFHLRKWRSNYPEILCDLSERCEAKGANLEIHPDNCSKALGLLWDSTNDSFIFNVNWKFEDQITKRSFLSQSARIFDPLGFLSPCTILIKIFYQQLWLLKLDWDSSLPDHFTSQWLQFQREFQKICQISITRWIFSTNKEITLHGFSDASESAYACVIYAVQQRSDSTTKVTLLAAKGKVAPLKPVSIPRLELNGALLLTRLYSTLVSALKDYHIQFYAWTDSQVVLSWLSSPPRKWKPYIANRTSEILDSAPLNSWRYVPSKDNPADIASRGLFPKDLPNCALWWEGPPWLSSAETDWPKQPQRKDNSHQVLKEKKNSKFAYSVFLKNDIIDNLFDVYSCYTKLINVLAFCFRFLNNCKGKKQSNAPITGKLVPLTSSERNFASNFVVSYVQNVYFSDEFKCLQESKSLPNKSPLAALCPFIDQDGLLRVGGRLQNSPLQFEARHPVILPNEHMLSKLIVQYFHKLHLHAGGNLLMGILRQTYWIIGVKRIIKKCVHNCTTCCRFRSNIAKQKMADLPKDRVTANRAFLVSGVDYAGPISVLKHRGRGAKTTKGYIVVFVCFSTKAIHLELASDLTSETFIAALKRFCSRRGAPKHMHSDNGSNFLGAKRQLSELFQLISSIQRDEKISFFLSQRNIEWHTIPPLSPHFGGLWESVVKSVKFHLKRVIANSNLTFEELTTLLTQIEAILNSRPLLKLNDDNDVDNLNTLTPSHFLIGEVITSPPEIVEEGKISLRSRWDIIQKMKLNFWKRWHLDYLSSLQSRPKWKSSRDNFKIGDVVIIKEDNVPPAVWPLGKIVVTHPGKDNLVRVVTVKTLKGLFKRPISKLVLLPVHQE